MPDLMAPGTVDGSVCALSGWSGGCVSDGGGWFMSGVEGSASVGVLDGFA